jgi:hypothetical protein
MSTESNIFCTTCSTDGRPHGFSEDLLEDRGSILLATNGNGRQAIDTRLRALQRGKHCQPRGTTATTNLPIGPTIRRHHTGHMAPRSCGNHEKRSWHTCGDLHRCNDGICYGNVCGRAGFGDYIRKCNIVSFNFKCKCHIAFQVESSYNIQM